VSYVVETPEECSKLFAQKAAELMCRKARSLVSSTKATMSPFPMVVSRARLTASRHRCRRPGIANAECPSISLADELASSSICQRHHRQGGTIGTTPGRVHNVTLPAPRCCATRSTLRGPQSLGRCGPHPAPPPRVRSRRRSCWA
jgi:hypothetical protein